MSDSPQNINSPLFTNPLETFPGLSIDDLNKYLPAIRTVEDMSFSIDQMEEGLFLAKCLDGLKQLPDNSIDLIIADPPEDPWNSTEEIGQRKTLQEYYQWNKNWLEESYRVLKNTGAIYLFSPWQYSGMYHGLLSNTFKIQTRITWRKKSNDSISKHQTWENDTSEIWFATKTDDFYLINGPWESNQMNRYWIMTLLNRIFGWIFRELQKKMGDIRKNYFHGSLNPVVSN